MPTTSDKSKKAARAKRPGKSKRASEAKTAKAPNSGSQRKSNRLRPGEMDGLVLGCLREHETEWPMTATAVAKLIGRSGGAVANCLHRLSGAKPRRARLATNKPRAYDLKGVKDAKA
jgi:hypothetical protein